MVSLADFGREKIAELRGLIQEFSERVAPIGFKCSRLSIEEQCELYVAVSPPAVQFRVQAWEEVIFLTEKLRDDLGFPTVHLPELSLFNEVGELRLEDALEDIVYLFDPVSYASRRIFHLATSHLDFTKFEAAKLLCPTDADSIDIARKVFNFYAKLVNFLKNLKMVATFENMRNKPHKHGFADLLSARPEHMVAIRERVSEILAREFSWTKEELEDYFGFTFDVSHAVGDGVGLGEIYPPEVWFNLLGEAIRFIHLHDVEPVFNNPEWKSKTHRVVGTGIINFRQIFELHAKHSPQAKIILELRTPDEILESARYLVNLRF